MWWTPWIVRLLIFSVWLILIGFQSSVAFGYGYGGILLLLCMVFLSGLLVSWGLALRSKKWRTTGRWAGSLFLLISSVWIAGSINHVQKERATRSAQPLLAAVAAFHQQHKRYPDSIAQLIPDFLQFEPRPHFGFGAGTFQFDAKDGHFSVAFDVPDWKVCSYDSVRRSWRTFD